MTKDKKKKMKNLTKKFRKKKLGSKKKTRNFFKN